MTKENNLKSYAQIHEELWEAGLEPKEIQEHINQVSWYRYLDTLSPSENLLRQAADAEHQQINSYHDDDGYSLEVEGLTDSELNEIMTEQAEIQKEYEQLKADVRWIKDKLNDSLIEQYLIKMLSEGSLQGGDNKRSSEEVTSTKIEDKEVETKKKKTNSKKDK